MTPAVLELPGVQKVISTRSVPSRLSSGLTFNGLLHAWNATAVNSPSKLSMFWTGRGRANEVGVARANPLMTCTIRVDIGGDCLYKPGQSVQQGAPQGGGMVFPLARIWTYQNQGIFLAADGSAKTRHLGAVLNPGSTDPLVDPYEGYAATGIPRTFWWDGKYPFLFRPDFEFDRR
jgi:hypothetical protein